jgi:hypothetical protein
MDRNVNGETRYAELVAQGQFQPELMHYWSTYRREEVPFSMADLQDPVPASKYFDARADDCWWIQSHCTVITDDTYRPKLAFKRGFWRDLFSQYYHYCPGADMVDPPITLREIQSTALRRVMCTSQLLSQHCCKDFRIRQDGHRELWKQLRGEFIVSISLMLPEPQPIREGIPRPARRGPEGTLHRGGMVRT